MRRLIFAVCVLFLPKTWLREVFLRAGKEIEKDDA